MTVQDALALHALEKLSEARFAYTKVFYAPHLSVRVHENTIMHLYVHDPICHECMRPGSKDHLALTTAFACTMGWSLKPGFTVIQSTSRITTLGGAPEKCPYSRSVLIPKVPLYVLQLDVTLLWAWKFCRYSRIVAISAVAISEVDCTYFIELGFCRTR